MFYSRKIWLLPIIAFCFASCKIFKSSKPSPVSLPEVGISAENNPLTIYRATATKHWELIHTQIDISFQLADKTAEATAVLRLHPYFYATDSVVMDAKGMKIFEVKDHNGRSLPFIYDTMQLAIRLPKIYTQKDTLKLSVKYKAMPYGFASGGNDAILEDKGLYFVNTDKSEPYKPVQIWTQGEAEASSHWFPTFDKPNFRSSFEITMHVPDTFKTLSNGVLRNAKKEANGMRADTWVQSIPIPPYLVMMAASNFHIATESWRGKEVSYLVPQKYASYAKNIFAHTPEMLTFYSQLLGVDFPWDKYSQVVGYDYVSGAMENVSASLFGAFNLKDDRALLDNNNDFIVAHELFHQWFGDYVTAESWSNLTLNESFADYGEYLWAEHKYGKESMQLNWCKGLEKYLNQAAWSDPHLVRFHYVNEGEMFDRVSYSKGGLILHYLRQLVGDEAFFAALQLYLKKNALNSAEVTQLRLALEAVTGQDWNWFFNQWYYNGGHPKLEISYVYDDVRKKITVNVNQAQDEATGLYRLPIKAQLLNASSIKELGWDITQKRHQFVYDYPNGERPIIIPEAGHWLPSEIKENKTASQWAMQYNYSNDFISKRIALKALTALKRNDTAEASLLTALADKSAGLRQLAISSKSYASNSTVSKTWMAALGKIAQSDSDNKAKASAIKALGNLNNKDYITVYEQAIEEKSYLVAAAGLFALDKLNHKRAVELARKQDFSQCYGSELLFTAAEIIATEGKNDDYALFDYTIQNLFERDRIAFLTAFQEYLVHVKDDVIYKQGVDLLANLIQRDASARNSYYVAITLFNLKEHANQQTKIATDKNTIDGWKSKKEMALNAWNAYKKSVTDANLKSEIEKMEKENQ